MSIIHDKFIFVHIPKTGGSSLKQMFHRCYPGTLRVEGEKHMPIRDYTPEQKAGKFVFTICRNPFARQWSLYNHVVRSADESGLIFRNRSFKEYFFAVHKQPQFYQEYYLRDIDQIDAVYQTENFSSMIANLCYRFGFKFNRINRDGMEIEYDRDYSKYYDDEMIGILVKNEPTLMSLFEHRCQ